MHPRKLVVIITEGALENNLARELIALGAHGYTVSDVRGRGSRGTRESALEADRNIRIDVICDEAVAERIATAMQERYYDNYAMTLFVADIGVLRPQKF